MSTKSNIFTENCFFLTGPTASGKTALALDWAGKKNAEILSMDSVAIYREMNVGSAKPSLEEQRLVPHHLIDLVNPDEEFSVVEYLHHAEIAVRDCLQRGKTPLFVGGTPLYLKALIFGLFNGPEGDEVIRESLRQQSAEAKVQGDFAFLHRKLNEVDPITAARLHPNDERRIIRALEVYQLTGKPIHVFQTQFQSQIPPQMKERIHIMDLPRPDLYARIEQRVDWMFENGFMKEVCDLRQKYGTLSRTASLAVGYREVYSFLERQTESASIMNAETNSSFVLEPSEELITEIKTHTRQMAKRQATWFRSLLSETFQF